MAFEIESPVAHAEALLLEAATPVYRGGQYGVQLRELAPETRRKAEELMEAWEGTDQQQVRAHLLYTQKEMAMSRQW